ncbi:HEAT repeat domain-containing protein [Nocardia callitridis]|uniref:HEAT repeat domain-containing protein n=1 Tax=Nocardia callitridis TaxID=648753 RepID=A0ABP9L245_9NOCA
MSSDLESDLLHALTSSRDENTGVRLSAVVVLSQNIEDLRAKDRLVEMLDDDNVTVEVDAAEALARFGGVDGVLAVLENLGGRGDDSDADYLAYKLYELNARHVISVSDIADTVDVALLSENQQLGLQDVAEVGGDFGS